MGFGSTTIDAGGSASDVNISKDATVTSGTGVRALVEMNGACRSRDCVCWVNAATDTSAVGGWRTVNVTVMKVVRFANEVITGPDGRVIEGVCNFVAASPIVLVLHGIPDGTKDSVDSSDAPGAAVGQLQFKRVG